MWTWVAKIISFAQRPKKGLVEPCHSMPPNSDKSISHLSSEEVYAVLNALSAADTRRARRWGQRIANNLPGWTGDDLFQEAMTKFLAGDRQWKRGVAAFTSLAFAMRSIADNVRGLPETVVVNPMASIDNIGPEHTERERSADGIESIEKRTPLSILEAKDELKALTRSLEGDENVELVAMAWIDKLRGKEAADAAGLDEKTYDAARNRLRRKLDEFNTSEEKS